MRWFTVALVALSLASCTGAGPPPTPELSTSREAVRVPDLVGLSLDDARQRLDDLGLTLGAVQVVTGDYTEAAVLEQDPPAGTQVSAGIAIDVVTAAPINK